MKFSDIRVGREYEANVCGRLLVVRITRIRALPSPPGVQKAVVLGVDKATGQRVTIRSPQGIVRRTQ